MNEIQIFNNSEFGEIRTVMINNEAYFVGKDVAEALNYSNSRDAIAKIYGKRKNIRKTRLMINGLMID